MGITALSGPYLQYGVTTTGSTDGLTGRDVEYNDQRAPMVADLGNAMMDPRAFYAYEPGGAVTDRTFAFYRGVGYVDYSPDAASSIAIVSVTASSSIAGTALTLQAASSARGTYSTDLIAPESGATLTSVLTFDSSDATKMVNAFGQTGTVNTWAPGWGAGRCISVYTASYSDSPVTVEGRDIYGYKISERIDISSAGAVGSSFGGIGQKAFKFVDAVYNSSTPTSTGIKVGTTDRYGFPMYVPYYGMNIQVQISSANTVGNSLIALTSANAILAYASTATATSTTPDVRGIFISSVAFAGAYRLQMQVTPAASAVVTISATNVAPLFGATQYSSF
jgi:hypothetical protein